MRMVPYTVDDMVGEILGDAVAQDAILQTLDRAEIPTTSAI